MDKSDSPLEDRRKAQEEDYFRKQNQEAAKKLAAKQALEAFGIKDQELQQKLTEVGFNSDSARALFLVPLIDVAWADGVVQDEERRAVLALMKEKGIEEGSAAYSCAESWMSSPPKDQKYLTAKELLSPVMAELKKTSGESPDWVLDAAEKVAGATGGLFGFGWNMISKEERKVLKNLSDQLKS